MSGSVIDGMREIGQHSALVAISLPLFSGALVVASSLLMPRGKAKGLITGMYALLASLGGACLLFGGHAGITGEPRSVVIPLLLPGIVLTVIMGILASAAIHEYQLSEFRKLAAEIFRRSHG